MFKFAWLGWAVHGELLNWTKIRRFHGFWYRARTRCCHPCRSSDRHRRPFSTAGRPPLRRCWPS